MPALVHGHPRRGPDASALPSPRSALPDRRGWLRSPAFDAWLIGGTLALALVLGAVAGTTKAALGWVLFLDFWLLAHPHVGAMYTRIAFDKKSARQHWFLLVGLPPLVLAATASLAWAGGIVVLNSVYFYWQSWHYTRQSYGIARAYQRSGGARARDLTTDVVLFAFPLWGVLHRAHQRPSQFYGMPLWCPPAPTALVLAVGSVAVGAFALWAFRELRQMQSAAPTSAPGHALFVLSHVAITLVSYLAVDEVTKGWLYVNIWHNAQYILFVWAFNVRRFQGGYDVERPLLSRLSQPSNWAAYAGACLVLSTLFYVALNASTARLASSTLPIVLVLHQTVNFHHYLIDAVIWRSPRAAPRAPHGVI
ncbi:MAG: hypothetical protein MUF34_13650 [Polyangiaceae bacterium]|nr:hypothetical protein [Polyangiaceae bacterium]